MPVGPYPTFDDCVTAQKAAYRKKNPDWTEEHLDQVAGAVCGQMEKMMQQGFRVTYQAAFEPFTKDNRNFVKVYGIDNDVNKNAWGVTPEARAKSMRTFFQHPLLGPPELSDVHVFDNVPGHPHYGKWAVIGHPVDFESNSATYPIYEVDVAEAWRRIQAGEMDAVSPSVHINDARYTDDGEQIITDFDWDHMLFVPRGAIEKAGVVGLCSADDPSKCSFRRAVQAAFQGHGLEPSGSTPRQNVAGYSLIGNPTEKKSEDTQGGVFVKNTETLAQAADAWSTADAPDKFFAIVPDSAKGPDGNKSDRKLPLASIQKKDYDEAIIANALARLPQTDFAGTGSSMAAATAKICQAAHSIGYDPPSCQSGQGEATGEKNMPNSEEKLTEQGCKEAQAKVTMDLAQANQKIKDLEGRIQARDETELNEKVAAVFGLEVQAGFIKEDKKAERITELKKLGAPALVEMQAKYTEMVKKIQAAAKPREPHVLKAEFDEAMKDPAQAANLQEQLRQAQFHRTRTPEDIAKLEAAITGVR
jgi:hypothetical protein